MELAAGRLTQYNVGWNANRHEIIILIVLNKLQEGAKWFNCEWTALTSWPDGILLCGLHVENEDLGLYNDNTTVTPRRKITLLKIWCHYTINKHESSADSCWGAGRPLSRMGWDFTDTLIQNFLDTQLNLQLVMEQDVKVVLIGLAATLASLVS